jgi:hypothetical protein
VRLLVYEPLVFHKARAYQLQKLLQNRFRSEVTALHEACANGELGEIYFAKAHAIRRKAVPTWGVFPDKSQQGGGPLIICTGFVKGCNFTSKTILIADGKFLAGFFPGIHH